MLNIRRSQATNKSEKFKETAPAKGDNLDWIEAQRKLIGDPGKACLLLLGGKGAVDFRVRVAQSHLRDDLTPSHWSHVALMGEPAKALADTQLHEISLDPPDGFAYPPVSNAVQIHPVGRYRSATAYPNIAIVAVPLRREAVLAQLERFKGQRAVLDAVEQMILWLAFVWGAGRAGNPLLDGQGIPAATMLEYVIGAAGYELTPGLASRSSCPEAIWQSARWWHDYPGRSKTQALHGVWRLTHFLTDEVNVHG